MVVEQSPGIRDDMHAARNVSIWSEYFPFYSKTAAFKNNGGSAKEIFDIMYCAAAARLEGESVAAASETPPSFLPGDVAAATTWSFLSYLA